MIPRTILVIFLLLVSTLRATTQEEEKEEESLPRDEWYKKYSDYPTLCSTPDQLETRHIPPLLPPTDKAYTSQLLHASVIIRHGARTPLSIKPCWKGYGDVGSDTAVWNCNLVSLSASSSTENVYNTSMFIYEKKYDALYSPTTTMNNNTQGVGGVKNILNGTCQAGQLLQRGYDQQYINGQFLRRAYLWEEDETNTNSDGQTVEEDTRLILFNLSKQNNQWFVPITENGTIYHPWDEPFTYFRSDDDQRTIMSGQVLLQSLFHNYAYSQNTTYDGTMMKNFNPHISIHTADRSQDILAPNENMCPRLTLLSQRAKESHEYKKNFIHTKEVEFMQKFIQTELGIPTDRISTFRDHALDCLITTVCTDRNLPTALHYRGNFDYNDTTTNGSNLFERLLNYTILPKTFTYRYNDSAYSKLSMIPLWQEIISHFPSMNKETNISESNTKLALYSGHDTTLIPLLASLGERVWDGKEWIPYASMMVIEMHNILLNTDATVDEISSVRKKFSSLMAFRLIYNGVVLTDKVDGCTSLSDLCDVSFLMKRLSSFAQLDSSSWSCEVTNQEKETISSFYNEFTNEVSLASAFFHTAGGKMILFLLILLSAFLSSLLTFVSMARKCPSWCCSRCCRRRDKEDPTHVRTDYESISFSPIPKKNDNIVKPGWKDPRRISDLRYVEVPSWFQDENHEIT